MTTERSFWATFPGVLTAVAALCGSLAALLPVMHSLGWIGSKPPLREHSAGPTLENLPATVPLRVSEGGVTGPASAAGDRTTPTSEDLRKHTEDSSHSNRSLASTAGKKAAPDRNVSAVTNPGPKKEPARLPTSACGEPASESLKFWDFDVGCTSSQEKTPQSDFWFKPNNHRDPNSHWGVDVLHGAKFAPRHPDEFPWEVDGDEFTSSSGVYSIPPKKRIPCITSEGLLCQFMIWQVGDQRRLTIFRYRLE